MTQVKCAQHEYWAIPVSEHCFPELAERSAQVDRNSGFIGWLIETQALPKPTLLSVECNNYLRAAVKISSIHWITFTLNIAGTPPDNSQTNEPLPCFIYFCIFASICILKLSCILAPSQLVDLRADISLDAICFCTNCICLVFSLKNKKRYILAPKLII